MEKAAADIDGRLVGATVSTGMAFSSHGAFELPAMLLQADQALYRAKNEGRNRLAIAMAETAMLSEQNPAEQSRADGTPHGGLKRRARLLIDSARRRSLRAAGRVATVATSA